MDCPILKLENICKELNFHTVLDNVNLDLHAGEVLGLMGQNGAGKSMLVSVVSGRIQPDSGRVICNEKPVSFTSPAQAITAGIAVLYQSVNLIPNLTVAENIFLGHWPKNRFCQVDRKKMKLDACNLLAKLDPSIDCNTLASSLCYSQKRTVELAKALALRSKILILDEPCINYTGVEIEKFRQMLEAAKSYHVGIILISHQIDSVLHLCDNVVFMRDGRTTGKISKDCLSNTDLVQFFSDDAVSHLFPKIKTQLGHTVFDVKDLCSESLEHVSFHIRKHEILGVVGTSLNDYHAIGRAISGKESIYSGSISMNATPFIPGRVKDMIHSGIGYLSNNPSDNLFYNLGIAQNITITDIKQMLHHWHLHTKLDQTFADELIELLNIKIPPYCLSIRELSLGNLQKIRLAQLLFANCRTYILEDPTAGIDICSKIDVYNLITNMALSGSSFLIISTDLDELIGMCDKIIVLRNGQIAKEIPRDSFSREYLTEVISSSQS